MTCMPSSESGPCSLAAALRHAQSAVILWPDGVQAPGSLATAAWGACLHAPWQLTAPSVLALCIRAALLATVCVFAELEGRLRHRREEGASSMLNETFEDFETESGDGQPFAMDSSLGGAHAAGPDAPAEAGGDVSGDVTDPESADADGEDQ